VTLVDDAGEAVFEAGFFLGHMTNNMAEYNGLLQSLKAAGRTEATSLDIYSDSELLVRQINGEYRVKSPNLRGIFDEASAMLRRFSDWRVSHVRRESNTRADELANAAMDAGEDVVVTDLP